MTANGQPILHDAYGFRIDCTTADLETRHQCDLAQKQMAAKWDKMQGRQDRKGLIKDPAKLKKYCRLVSSLSTPTHNSVRQLQPPCACCCLRVV